MSEIQPYVGPADSQSISNVEGLEYYYPPSDRWKGRFNIYCKFELIDTIKSNLTSQEWGKLCDGCFGTILQVGGGLHFHGALVHVIMMHEVKTKKNMEMWFKVSGNLVRFSLLEFAAITGLNCSENSNFEIPKVDMESVLGVHRCSLSDLKTMFCKEKNRKKKIMLAHLLILEGILMPLRNESVRAESVAVASDMDLFYKYPWGRKVYLATLDSLRKLDESKKTGKRPCCNLLGYPLAFQIWILETFPHFPQICNVDFKVNKVKPCGPIWYSLSHDFKLSFRRVEEQISNPNLVSVLRYDAIQFGDFGWSDEESDEIIDGFVQWRLKQVLMPPQMEEFALNSEGGDKLVGAKAMRLRMKYAVQTFRGSTSKRGTEEKDDDKSPSEDMPAPKKRKTEEKFGQDKSVSKGKGKEKARSTSGDKSPIDDKVVSKKRKGKEGASSGKGKHVCENDDDDDFVSLATMRRHVLGDKCRVPRKVRFVLNTKENKDLEAGKVSEADDKLEDKESDAAKKGDDKMEDLEREGKSDDKIGGELEVDGEKEKNKDVEAVVEEKEKNKDVEAVEEEKMEKNEKKEKQEKKNKDVEAVEEEKMEKKEKKEKQEKQEKKNKVGVSSRLRSRKSNVVSEKTKGRQVDDKLQGVPDKNVVEDNVVSEKTKGRQVDDKLQAAKKRDGKGVPDKNLVEDSDEPKWAKTLRDDVRIIGQSLKSVQWRVNDLSMQVVRFSERQIEIDLKLSDLLTHLNTGRGFLSQTNSQMIREHQREADEDLKDILGDIKANCSQPHEHGHLFEGVDGCCGGVSLSDQVDLSQPVANDDKSHDGDDVEASANDSPSDQVDLSQPVGNDDKSHDVDPLQAHLVDDKSPAATDLSQPLQADLGDDKSPSANDDKSLDVDDVDPLQGHLVDDKSPAAADLGDDKSPSATDLVDDKIPSGTDLLDDLQPSGADMIKVEDGREDLVNNEDLVPDLGKQDHSDNEVEVQPNEGDTGLRRSSRSKKPSEHIISPYTMEKKKLPRRPKNSFYGEEERQTFFNWYLDDKTKSDFIGGSESRMDKQFFKLIVTRKNWLDIGHIDEAMFHLRKRIHFEADRCKDVGIMDCLWITRFNEAHMQKLFDGTFWFDESWTKYLDGLLPGNFGKAWFDLKKVYAPFIIPQVHWIALEIDLVEQQVNVYDCCTGLFCDSDLQAWLKPLCVMLPYFIHTCDRMAHMVKLDSPFKFNRVPNVAQDTQGGNCGIFTIKYIEWLAFGTEFKVDESNIQAHREKMAIELYNRTWVVDEE